MQQFVTRRAWIEAVQITDGMFDDDHPNDDLVRGATYDPVNRLVRVGFGRPTPGRVGDWIIWDPDERLSICDDRAFRIRYEVVPSAVAGRSFGEVFYDEYHSLMVRGRVPTGLARVRRWVELPRSERDVVEMAIGKVVHMLGGAR